MSGHVLYGLNSASRFTPAPPFSCMPYFVASCWWLDLHAPRGYSWRVADKAGWSYAVVDDFGSLVRVLS